MNKHKLIVGQKLTLVRSKAYHIGSNIEEVTIITVGNKYFSLEEYPRQKFELQTLKEHTQSNYVDQCYLTRQEVLDEREKREIEGVVRKTLKSYGDSGLSLGQLRMIQEIINSECAIGN